MGSPKVKKNKWIGAKYRRMAKLLEFKPEESVLFEALSVVFFVADQPTPAENKASIKAEDLFEKHGIEAKDSKFKTVACPACRQRVMVNPRIYTLPEGRGADIKMDDRIFDYIYSRFDQWKVIVDPALKRPFEALKEKFEEAKSNKNLSDYDQIEAYLKKRDAAPAAQKDDGTE